MYLYISKYRFFFTMSMFLYIWFCIFKSFTDCSMYLKVIINQQSTTSKNVHIKIRSMQCFTHMINLHSARFQIKHIFYRRTFIELWTINDDIDLVITGVMLMIIMMMIMCIECCWSSHKVYHTWNYCIT